MLGLFLQGSNAGHMLLVEHSRCVEHSELVHNGEAHQHIAAEHTLADSAAADGAPGRGSHGAHEHCTLSIQKRDALVARVAPFISTQRIDTSPQFAVAGGCFVARTARLQRAPKNSPPA